MIKIPVGLYFSLASLWRSCHNQKYDHDGWYNGPKYVYKICTVSVIGYYYKRNLTVSDSGGYLIGKSDVSEQNDAFEVYYTVMTLDNGVIILTADIEAFDYGKELLTNDNKHCKDNKVLWKTKHNKFYKVSRW